MTLSLRVVAVSLAAFSGRKCEIPNPCPGADTDGDGVGDLCDNCIEAPNADQLDTNGDNFGNACDGDLDNDGLVDSFSDFPLMVEAAAIVFCECKK